jgi:DNA-binding NtrC family response regulator
MEGIVVDEEVVVLESCKKILNAEGFEVALMSGADDALAALDKERFDLLLIDIKMPVRDGLCLMDALKQRKETIPIVVMSGYSTDKTINEAVQMGANIFIPKPFTPDELLSAVRKTIGEKTVK